jgi:hypothetical protein
MTSRKGDVDFISEQHRTTEQTGTAEVTIARRSSPRATARKPILSNNGVDKSSKV